MVILAIVGLLFGAITLDGVTGDQLSAEAVFDANNVRLGEPLLLQIDFQGVADLSNLHPPALSKAVDAKVWKVDDASAKTDTGRFIRRLTYRVRPLKEGLVYFPALSFSYERNRQRGSETFATRPIPVHVKPGQQAALAGDDSAFAAREAYPDGILIAVTTPLSEDAAFAWKKACARPSVEAFAPFDFPEARLNEAAAATLAGNWAHALNLYRKLEWKTGQTPAIERGIVAALSCRNGQATELPVWRQVLRPVLRYALAGRLVALLVVLALALGSLLLCRRLIRLVACVAVIALAPGVRAESIFDEMDRQMQQIQQQMMQMMNRGPSNGTRGYQMQISNTGGKVQTTQIIMNGSGTRTIVNGVEEASFQPVVSLRVDKADIRVGEPFSFILAIEHPKGYTIDVNALGFSEEYGLVSDERLERLGRGTGVNPSNVVDRLSIKARYDVPLKTALTVRLRGTAWHGAFGQGYEAVSSPLDFEVKPLPTDHQPAAFHGAVGAHFVLRQSVDRNCVSTNDVIILRHTLTYEGVMPNADDWFAVERRPHAVTWCTYFVADGCAAVPGSEIVYYDVNTRKYETVSTPPCPLTYVGDETGASGNVAMDSAAAKSGDAARVLKLRFYPSENAPVIGETTGRPAVTEEKGLWMRVDDSRRAGWVKKEEMR